MMKTYRVYWRFYGDLEFTSTIVAAYSEGDARARVATQNHMIQVGDVELL